WRSRVLLVCPSIGPPNRARGPLRRRSSPIHGGGHLRTAFRACRARASASRRVFRTATVASDIGASAPLRKCTVRPLHGRGRRRLRGQYRQAVNYQPRVPRSRRRVGMGFALSSFLALSTYFGERPADAVFGETASVSDRTPSGAPRATQRPAFLSRLPRRYAQLAG